MVKYKQEVIPMDKVINQSYNVRLYLCAMSIVILIVLLISSLLNKKNKTTKLLFVLSISLLISINILEIVIDYFKGYVRNYPFIYNILWMKDICISMLMFTLCIYICTEVSVLTQKKIIVFLSVLVLTIIAIIVGYACELIVDKNNIYKKESLSFISYIPFYAFVIYIGINAFITKNQSDGLIPLLISAIVIIITLLGELSSQKYFVISLESVLTIMILIIYNFLYNVNKSKELIK